MILCLVSCASYEGDQSFSPAAIARSHPFSTVGLPQPSASLTAMPIAPYGSTRLPTWTWEASPSGHIAAARRGEYTPTWSVGPKPHSRKIFLTVQLYRAHCTLGYRYSPYTVEASLVISPLCHLSALLRWPLAGRGPTMLVQLYRDELKAARDIRCNTHFFTLALLCSVLLASPTTSKVE